MAEVCDWSTEGRGGSKNHNLFQSNACMFPQWCNDYHDYLLVVTAECFVYYV